MRLTMFHDLVVRLRPGRVFTPRPASEALVARAAELAGGHRVRIADVGTGTGAIALALAHAVPNAEIWATDVDDEAVDLAAENVRAHGLASRVHVVHGDLLEPIPVATVRPRRQSRLAVWTSMPLDLIVANLPYLPMGEEDADVAGEPPRAVFGAGGDGLDLYRRLLVQAETRLRPGGVLLVQFRRRVLEARSGELQRLRAGLESLAAAA